jgi:hypothetical protein
MGPSEDRSTGPPLLVWLALPAALGFLAGFLGPIVLNPEANQGPLLGIFITGPLGAALGLALGLLARLARLPAPRQWLTLAGVSGMLVVGTLVACLPEPRLVGHVIEAEIRGCWPPSESLDQAVHDWTRRLAGTEARPGWQEDARRSAALDPGVVLEVATARRYGIYEHRKPWNQGRLEAHLRPEANAPPRYHAAYAGRFCDAYPAGSRVLLYAERSAPPTGGGPPEWPPTSDVPGFLGLSPVVPASDEHRRLIGRAGGR